MRRRGEINLADFCTLITPLVGGLGSLVAAKIAHVPVAATVLCVLGGLVLGFGIAVASHRLTYTILDSKKLPDAAVDYLYTIVPQLSVVGTLVLAMLLVLWVF